MMRCNVKVHTQKPQNFLAQMEAAGCYMEIDNKLLIVQIGHGKAEAGAWGVPGGKLEKGETAEQAAIRELFEETNILISTSQIHYLSALYIQQPGMDFIYHMFQVSLAQLPKVSLSVEHQNYQWASVEDLENLPLMAGEKEVLEHYKKHSSV